MYEIYERSSDNILRLYKTSDGVGHKRILFFNIPISMVKTKPTSFSDLVFSFGSKVVVGTNDIEDAPRNLGEDIPYTVENGSLDLYANNEAMLKEIMHAYPNNNTFLKSYTPIDNVSEIDKAPVIFNDAPDGDGIEVILENISVTEFEKRLDKLEKANTSPLKPDYSVFLTPLYIPLLLILFVVFSPLIIVILILFAIALIFKTDINIKIGKR